MPSLDNAHALVIGIADYASIRKLPRVRDAQDIAALLADPSFSGYPAGNVRLLQDGQATRDAIRAGLADLAARCDADSTALVYFSGHGGRIESGPGAGQYLLPVDVAYPGEAELAASAISGEEFRSALGAIAARRLLVLFDCCHSGGIGGVGKAFAQDEEPPLRPGLAESYLDRLKSGRGRAILASSRADEVSFVREGATYGVFTQHLLDGLRGGAPGPGGVVRICDLFHYVQQAIAGDMPGQHPVFKAELEENFAVALYKGGRPEAPAAIPPRPADAFVYDCFLNYNNAKGPDRDWVRKVLYPRLKAEGLKVCIDSVDFRLGEPQINEMERAVVESRYTIAVLSPSYLQSGFADFEGVIAQHLVLELGQRRFIGLLREDCSPRLGIRALYYLDMTDDSEFDMGVARLAAQLRQPPDRKAAAT